jgi:hypothetical protein
MEPYAKMSVILYHSSRLKRNPGEATHSHEDTAYTYVWTQPLAYPRRLPEDAHDTVLVPVHDPREEVVHVGTCADIEEDDEEERLEVEEGRLGCGSVGGS